MADNASNSQSDKAAGEVPVENSIVESNGSTEDGVDVSFFMSAIIIAHLIVLMKYCNNSE